MSAVLDALKTWYDGDVDVQHAGVMGHSRGSVTALAVAGGSVAGARGATCAPTAPPDGLCWAGVRPDARVKAHHVDGSRDPDVDLAPLTIPTLSSIGSA